MGSLRPIMPSEAILLVESGIVEERVELIDGELWIVSPQSETHAKVIARLARVLFHVYGEPAQIRLQSPASVSGPSLPEPGLAVSRPTPEWHRPGAADLVLVVEVTLTSHARERRKAVLYAEAGIAELWLIDVEGRGRHRLHPAPSGRDLGLETGRRRERGARAPRVHRFARPAGGAPAP